MNKDLFTTLQNLFESNGFKIYMIGGSTRDYLLGLEVFDYDFVTDATPDEMKNFLENADYTFARFGAVKAKVNNIKVDITTLRKETNYNDYRHPGKIEFVKTIEEDYVRRDFTINALYLDKNFNVIDPSNGLEDLKNKTIRFIGDPDTRIKEDPLRILRARRFAHKLGFQIEEKTQKSIANLEYLLEKLNPEKVKEEQRKFNSNK